MKVSIILFFLAGIASAYLLLLWQKQQVTVVQPHTSQNGSFSYSVDEAPKETLRATIASLSGTVNWTSRTATAPAALLAGTVLQQGESVETGDTGELTVLFPGNTTCKMSPASSMELIQTLPQRIVVKETAGTIVFSPSTNPLTVKVFHAVVRLEGTAKITADPKTGTADIEVMENGAQIGFNDLDYKSITVSLRAGKSYTYDDASRDVSVAGK